VRDRHAAGENPLNGALLDRELLRLRKRIRGAVVEPGDPGYEAVRRVWNGSIDRYPRLVVQCRTVSDVVAAVECARSADLIVAVRGGGHSIAGFSTCDGGIVIDLSPMKRVAVDPERRRVQAEGGVVWGELDRATQAFGLAVTGGLVSSTGIGGFTLGGGLGWLMREQGLTCDSLVSAEVVTAEGRRLRASTTENADLLWGLRGGGGNFGIVTSFEIEVHEVGPDIVGGFRFYPGDRAEDVLRVFRDVSGEAPDALQLGVVLRLAPPAPFIPESFHGKPVAAIGACYAGPIDDAWRALEQLDALGTPLADLLGVTPYTSLQTMLDAAWAPGLQNYWKAEYLKEVSDAAAAVLVDGLHSITSPLSDFKVFALGGALARVAEDATAYSHRDAPFVLNINARWSNAGEADRHVAWTSSLWDAMQPFSAGGGYTNWMGNEGTDRLRAAYGERTFERLVDLKRRYDPTNFFRLNQNIPVNFSSDEVLAADINRR
jgi:FAD/FMN-containing dehydrogenase